MRSLHIDRAFVPSRVDIRNAGPLPRPEFRLVLTTSIPTLTGATESSPAHLLNAPCSAVVRFRSASLGDIHTAPIPQCRRFHRSPPAFPTTCIICSPVRLTSDFEVFLLPYPSALVASGHCHFHRRHILRMNSLQNHVNETCEEGANSKIRKSRRRTRRSPRLKRATSSLSG